MANPLSRRPAPWKCKHCDTTPELITYPGQDFKTTGSAQYSTQSVILAVCDCDFPRCQDKQCAVAIRDVRAQNLQCPNGHSQTRFAK